MALKDAAERLERSAQKEKRREERKYVCIFQSIRLKALFHLLSLDVFKSKDSKHIYIYIHSCKFESERCSLRFRLTAHIFLYLYQRSFVQSERTECLVLLCTNICPSMQCFLKSLSGLISGDHLVLFELMEVNEELCLIPF